MDFDRLTRPANPLARLLSRALVATLVVAAVAAFVGWYGGKWRALAQASAQPAVAQATAPAPEPAAIADVEGEHRAAEINQALSGGWEKVLKAIEQSSGADVTLLALHPDLRNGRFEIEGEARKFEAVADYVRRLNATGLVHDVSLLHEEPLAHDNVETIGFKLSGEYTRGGPP